MIQEIIYLLRTGITVNLLECTGYGRITSVILLEPAIIEDFFLEKGAASY